MTDDFVSEAEAVDDAADAASAASSATSAASPGEPDFAALAAERTADLQRLQAEYVNYKRRVDRDRDMARQRGVEAVLADLLPVLDAIEAARSHDELTGPSKQMADELTKVTTKYGLEQYGEVGDPFNPQIHEALMHVEAPGYSVETCAQIFQPGYRIGDRVVRPARVAVADPTEPAEPSPTDDASEAVEATVVGDEVPDDISSLSND